MNTIMKIMLLLIFSLSGYAQNAAEFKKDFTTALNHTITNNMADSLISKHFNLLVWFYVIDAKAYPLLGIKNEYIYQKYIDKLFADTGQKINRLACLLAASTYDTSKIAEVKKVLKRSNYKDIFAAKSLLVLGENDLSSIAKCIIAYDFDERVQYLTSDFLNVEKGILEKFACDSLFSHDQKIQYLAVKAMAVIPPKSANEQLLRKAVVNYDTKMKGWAIAALEVYKANDILPLVKSFLNNNQLKQVSWRALAVSTSSEDINYINLMITTKQGDPDFLNALLNSNQETHLKNWLFIVRKNELPKDYYINISRNEAIKSDKYFNDICEIIINSTNEMQAYSLMGYFEGRKDKASIDYLNKCLTHTFVGVKEKAKELLSN